jgi:hypothetical protein
MKQLFTLLLLNIILVTGLSQGNSISGILNDDANSPVMFANLALYNTIDTSLVKVETTDENGVFNLRNIAKGEYSIIATYVGFEDLKLDKVSVNKDVNLGVLSFLPSAIQLDEAVITAQRSLVEVKADRMVFNVQGTVNSVGDNGIELLRKAPGVLVDNNNNISVLGRSGVIFYVDGKRLPLSGNELSNYLENLTAQQIDRIDIISNPGAKYEAEGNAGIIDIRLKKDKNLGYNGSLSSSVSQGKELRGNVNLSGNYRNKTTNIFGSIGYNDFSNFNNMDFKNFQNGFVLDETNRQINKRQNTNLRIGTDYFINDKNTLGFLVTNNYGSGSLDASNRSDISMLATPETLDSILVATNNSKNTNRQNTFNINYVFRSGETTLNIDADYGKFTNDEDFLQPNTYYSPDETTILNVINTATTTPSDIDIYTFKIDYEMPLLNGTLGIGSKFSKVMTDNTFLFYDIPDNERVRNDDRSNSFIYDENVYAGYINYARSLGNKMSMSAGLRLEQTDAMGDLQAFKIELQEPKVLINYLSTFPSLGLTYALAQEHSLSMNAGRRINRPDYNVLNPFRTQLSELSFAKGNPFLQAEIVNNIEMGYTLKYRYNFKISYSKTEDQITRLIGPDDTNPKAGFISWDNLANQQVYAFNASLPFEINSWWSAYFNVNGSYINNQSDYGNGAVVDLQAWSYSFFTQNTLKLGNGFSGEISGYYSGPGIWGGVFRYDPNYSLNFGLQKKFDPFNIRLSVQDITYQSGWSGYSDFNGLYAEGAGNWDSRRVGLSVSYDFGNSNVKSRRRKTGIEDESNRVGNE